MKILEIFCTQQHTTNLCSKCYFISYFDFIGFANYHNFSFKIITMPLKNSFYYFRICWFPLSLYIMICNKYGNKTTNDLGRLLKSNYQWLKYIRLLFATGNLLLNVVLEFHFSLIDILTFKRNVSLNKGNQLVFCQTFCIPKNHLKSDINGLFNVMFLLR